MKTKKNRVVPKLRFPEFRDGGDWEEKNLIDVADKGVKWSFIGGPFGSNLKASDYTNKGVRVIQLQNIGDGEFVNDSKIYTSVEKADELLANNIYPHDIIMSKMGDPVGRACIIPDTHDRYVMCSDGIRLVVDEDKYSKYFVYSFINSDTFRASVESKSTGSTRKRIGLSHLKNLPLLIPNLPEQQKIADCLSSLDDLINAENEQLDALQEYKAGLLQQLFPVEGETTPKLRFAEFKDDGDWEEVKLGDLCKVLMCKRIFADQTNTLQGVPFYKIGTLGSSPDAFISQDLYEDYKNRYNFPKQGEVLLTCSGTVGKTIIYDGEDAYYQDSNIVWLDNPMQRVKNELLYYIINNVNWGILNSTTITRIYGDDLRRLNIQFPSCSKEQQKIVDCLSSLDNLIQAKDSQIDTLKNHKQGLMQQLFPTKCK